MHLEKSLMPLFSFKTSTLFQTHFLLYSTVESILEKNEDKYICIIYTYAFEDSVTMKKNFVFQFFISKLSFALKNIRPFSSTYRKETIQVETSKKATHCHLSTNVENCGNSLYL